ncbi:MAG: hypothetical protein ACW98D_19245 [Promethearchaeota archaeon]|jgi:hypothetical protein
MVSKDELTPPPPPPDIIDLSSNKEEKKISEDEALAKRPANDWIKELREIQEKYGNILNYAYEGPTMEFITDGLEAMEYFIYKLKKAQAWEYSPVRVLLLRDVSCAMSEIRALRATIEDKKASKLLADVTFFGYPYR